MKLGRAGGVEQSTHELLAALARLDRKNHYILYCPRSTYYELGLPSGFSHTVCFSDRWEVERRRLCGTETRLPSSDVVHSLIGYIHPDLADRTGVLTIADLQHLHYPSFFSPQDLATRENHYGSSARLARQIICISEFTRHDVHQRLGVPQEKLQTIGIIPGAHAQETLTATQRERLLASLDIHGPYVFFPAHPWLHKNHDRLLQAWDKARRQLPPGWTLVLTGKPFPPDHPATERLQAQIREGSTRHLGYRSPLEMQAVLQGCELLVFPSLFEGFGLPVAEAIIAGRPVACSQCTSLPEIAGDAAAYFDPLSIEDMSRVLVDASTNPRLRDRLLLAAAARRQRFDPLASAAATLGVYLRTAGVSNTDAATIINAMKVEAAARPPVARGLRLARACHHARAAETAALAGKIITAAQQTALTFIHSPTMSWRRLILAWLCQLEIFVRRLPISKRPAPANP